MVSEPCCIGSLGLREEIPTGGAGHLPVTSTPWLRKERRRVFYEFPGSKIVPEVVKALAQYAFVKDGGKM